MDSVRKEQKSMVLTYRDRFPTGRVEGARRFSPASRLSGVSLLWTKMGGGASPGRRPQPFDARRFQIVDPQGAWYSMILNHFAIVFGRASHPRPDHLEYTPASKASVLIRTGRRRQHSSHPPSKAFSGVLVCSGGLGMVGADARPHQAH